MARVHSSPLLLGELDGIANITSQPAWDFAQASGGGNLYSSSIPFQRRPGGQQEARCRPPCCLCLFKAVPSEAAGTLHVGPVARLKGCATAGASADTLSLSRKAPCPLFWPNTSLFAVLVFGLLCHRTPRHS